jgi:hypothetical protein
MSYLGSSVSVVSVAAMRRQRHVVDGVPTPFPRADVFGAPFERR